jgi:hypothetical protein
MTTNSSKATVALQQKIKARLLSFFIENGFEIVPLSADEKKSREIRTAFPFGRLKRSKAGDLELVEIQLDKHGKPSFIINFGIAPKEGVTLPWGVHLAQDQVDVSALKEAFRLSHSRWRAKWFNVGPLSSTTEESLEKLVDTVAWLCPQVIAWFSKGVVGSHIRRFGFGS